MQGTAPPSDALILVAATHSGNASDPACNPRSGSNPLRGRCGAIGPIAATATWGGQPWVRMDCRDSTAVVQLDTPLLPLAPGMATNDGLVDVIFPGEEAMRIELSHYLGLAGLRGNASR